MTNDKKHAPDSLKYQWKLLGLVQRADWATGLDKSVAYEVIDNYYSKFGNSRTSLRYLEKATGAARQNVIVSLRRLCENGPFSVARKGSGVRPTEYNLHFDRVAENASGHADVTASDDFPSGHADSTSGGHADVTTNAASGHADSTESVLLVPAYKADVLDRMNDTRPPTAPLLGDGLAATPARGSAVEERANSQADTQATFEALWHTYGHAKGKKEARAAWNDLPTEVNRSRVIEAAADWQASWAAQGKPDAPRFTLARWLKDERYDEDAPKGFQKVEKASKAKPSSGTKAKPSQDQDFPVGETKLTITKVYEQPSEKSSRLMLLLADDSGKEFAHGIYYEHYKKDVQDTGQDELQSLVVAAGFYFDAPEGTELVGRIVVAVVDEDGLSWHPPRDGQQVVAEPESVPQPDPEPETAPAPQQPARRWVSAEIIDSDKVEETVVLWFRTARKTILHEFLFDEKGERELASICLACGLDGITDTEELHCIPLKIELDGNEEIVGFNQAHEWEAERAKRLNREDGRREWDAAHPELFVDTPTDEAA